jgi:LysR family glycine cleavage system transcriptional activator
MLDEIREVTNDLSVSADRRPLVIGCPRMFLQKRVMPALGTLYARHPDMVVKFVTGGQDVEGLDGAIYVGAAARKGFVSEVLADADLSPVCSPAYLRSAPPLETPDDLERHTLLRSAEFTRNWERWLGPRAARIFAKARVIDFESSGLELTGAVEGLGIAIVRLMLMREELADGRLVALFERNIVHDHYSFMFAESRLRSSRFRLFRQWLRDAVAR